MDSKVMEVRLKQWMALLEEQAQSGLNKKEWCEQNGIKRSVFFRWQKVCRTCLLAQEQDKPVKQTGQEPAFVELPFSGNNCTPLVPAAAPASGLTSGSSITITRNGFCVCLNGEVDETSLARVLGVIAHAY